jgi:hypothetical protein
LARHIVRSFRANPTDFVHRFHAASTIELNPGELVNIRSFGPVPMT